MKERPSWPMRDWEARAIGEGRKSQTRRVVKPQPETTFPNAPEPFEFIEMNQQNGIWGAKGCGVSVRRCPYGKPGDRLWVREAYMVQPSEGCTFGEAMRGSKLAVHYRDGSVIDLQNGWSASGPGFHMHGVNHEYPIEKYGLWRSPIHMPRWASRFTLTISSVRVERLQEISEADAYAEGVTIPAHQAFASNGKPELRNEARAAYQALWNSLHGADSWAANPWVWVVEFKKLEGGAE